MTKVGEDRRAPNLRDGLVAGALASTAAGITASLACRHDLAAARARIRQAGSRVAQTACGPIEYSDTGQGYPVLISHGFGGGFDQAQALARAYVGDGFRIIAPSRSGYLGSPVPPGPSLAAQADSYACLLDKLGIQRVAVAALSAGGPPALMFALRHPLRCSSVVLWSSIVPGYPLPTRLPAFLVKAVFKSDPLFWFLTKYVRPAALLLMGVPPATLASLPPEEDSFISAASRAFNPISARTPGVLGDLRSIEEDSEMLRSRLGEVSAPVLMFHAKDDPLAGFPQAQEMAQTMRWATFIPFDRGGHPLLGNHRLIRQAVSSFIREHARLA